jgi:hypothetical protein
MDPTRSNLDRVGTDNRGFLVSWLWRYGTIVAMVATVRFGSKADSPCCGAGVRFTPENGQLIAVQ